MRRIDRSEVEALSRELDELRHQGETHSSSIGGAGVRAFDLALCAAAAGLLVYTLMHLPKARP